MVSKTTVAIDDNLRKTIKKLAAWLDVPQGEVIRRAIKEFEKTFLAGTGKKDENIDPTLTQVQKLYEEATAAVWATDPQSKGIQQRLMRSPEPIDNFILDNWDARLEG